MVMVEGDKGVAKVVDGDMEVDIETLDGKMGVAMVTLDGDVGVAVVTVACGMDVVIVIVDGEIAVAIVILHGDMGVRCDDGSWLFPSVAGITVIASLPSESRIKKSFQQLFMVSS